MIEGVEGRVKCSVFKNVLSRYIGATFLRRYGYGIYIEIVFELIERGNGEHIIGHTLRIGIEFLGFGLGVSFC